MKITVTHEPGCNPGCIGDSHYLIASGTFGEPFSHQDDEE